MALSLKSSVSRCAVRSTRAARVPRVNVRAAAVSADVPDMDK
eukprot:gene18089-24515_t